MFEKEGVEAAAVVVDPALMVLALALASALGGENEAAAARVLFVVAVEASVG
jgi:hypothetical protein